MTSFRRSLLWFAIQSGLLVAIVDGAGFALPRNYVNVSSSSSATSDTYPLSPVPEPDLLASTTSSTTSDSSPLSLVPEPASLASTTASTTSGRHPLSPVPEPVPEPPLLASTASSLISTSTTLLLSRTHSTTSTTSVTSSISPISTSIQQESGRVLTEITPPGNFPTVIVTASPASPPIFSFNPSPPLVTGPGGLLNTSSLSPVKPTIPPYGNNSIIATTITISLQAQATTSSCTSLTSGEAVTSWLFLPNTTTVTITVTGNYSATSTLTPEFTPPTYCPVPAAPATWPAYTATLRTSAGESSGTETAVATTMRFTTTVITTSKNAPTVFTTASIPQYGGNTDKESVSPSSYVDTYIWSPLPQPTFSSASPTETDSGSSDASNPSAPYTTIYNGGGSNPGPITETVDGITVVVSSTQVIIGGQTVSIGDGDKTITESGDVFTVNPSQVIGPSIIVNVPTQAGGQVVQTPTPTTVQGVSIDINPSTVVIAGTSYKIGDGAPQETIVAKGQTITVGTAGVIFSATTVSPPGGQPTNVVIVDGEVFSAVGSNSAVIDGKTFTYSPGAAPQTDVFNGETITIGPQGVSYDGTTLGGIANPTGTQLGIAGGLSITEVGSTLAIVNGRTLTFGPSASSTTLVISGQTITAGPSGLSIGGATLTAPFNIPTQAITAGGITFSEIGSSLAVIGSKTFTFGPGATTTSDVFNGQTISIGPSGIGFATTTFTAATSKATAAQSHTKNGAERLTFGNGVLGMCFMGGVIFFL